MHTHQMPKPVPPRCAQWSNSCHRNRMPSVSNATMPCEQRQRWLGEPMNATQRRWKLSTADPSRLAIPYAGRAGLPARAGQLSAACILCSKLTSKAGSTLTSILS